jgi:hypothetical protein
MKYSLVTDPSMRDLIMRRVLRTREIEQQLALLNTAFVIIWDGGAIGMAACSSHDGVLDFDANGEAGFEVEVDGGGGRGSRESEV